MGTPIEYQKLMTEIVYINLPGPTATRSATASRPIGSRSSSIGLLERCVAPGGRLILGSYGSLSRGTPPLDLPAVLAEAGLPLVGSACGGQNGIARFAWTDAAT